MQRIAILAGARPDREREVQGSGMLGQFSLLAVPSHSRPSASATEMWGPRE